jgi:hypothetical protein
MAAGNPCTGCLTTSSRFGHWTPCFTIGDATMCEVYQARDTKLDRDVALK